MKKINKIEPDRHMLPTAKKVAAYARVSKETERLHHSLSAQVSYYSSLIQKHPGWEYVGVYADYGITGTKTDARDEFQRLIADCENGKIDIILTKSISRFARNTVDLLETVRYLKTLGIEIRFEKEKINTLSDDGELMLSLLASFAQEESRSISENCKWGIRRRFQSGEIGTANKHILGYRYDDDLKKYVIIPEEAESVRWMFQMYIDGVSLYDIAENMNKAGIRTTLGNTFQENSIHQLIFNEIYAGDILRQKSFTPDPITKKKIPNRGELPQYFMEDCHEAIIDRDTYAKVKAEMDRRASLLNPTYCFTKMITCGMCGAKYTRKKGTVGGKTYIHWICRLKKEVGQTCTNINFSEDHLKQISAEILGTESFDEEVFSKRVVGMTVQENGDISFQLTAGETKIWKNRHIDDFRHQRTITDAFKAKFHCSICGNTYHRVDSGNKWVYWFCIGKHRQNIICNSCNYSDFQLRQISAHILDIDEFDEKTFTEQIDSVTVLEDGSLEYHFYDGRLKGWQRT